MTSLLMKGKRKRGDVKKQQHCGCTILFLTVGKWLSVRLFYQVDMYCGLDSLDHIEKKCLANLSSHCICVRQTSPRTAFVSGKPLLTLHLCQANLSSHCIYVR